jgi:nucleotide-binding universal stress UspA family protein
MKRFHSLLAATDFSDDANNACRRATLIAHEQNAGLELLHIISRTSLNMLRSFFPDAATGIASNAGQALEKLRAELATDGLAVTATVQEGTVAAEILAAMPRAELLVIGARGSSPLRDLMLGTTAERLLARASCPALVVKRPAKENYRRVLAPVDFSPYSATVLATAAAIAPAAEIQVCHAFDLPFEGKLWLAGVADEEINRYRAEARRQALTDIQQLVESLPALKQRTALPAVMRGDPARVILDQEAACNADLIVIGKQGNSALEEFLLGSVTRHVLADSKCDVLVVNVR